MVLISPSVLVLILDPTVEKRDSACAFTIKFKLHSTRPVNGYTLLCSTSNNI